MMLNPIDISPVATRIISEKGEQFLEVTKVREPIVEKKSKTQVLLEIEQVASAIEQSLRSVEDLQIKLSSLHENLALFD